MSSRMSRLILPSAVLLVLFGLSACASSANDLEFSEEALTYSGGFARQDAWVPFDGGAIHVEIVTTPRGLLRHNRRVVMMIPGTLANGATYYDVARGTGYNAAEVLAGEGYIVLLPDLPGTGESLRPADGSAVDSHVAARALRRVGVLAASSLLLGQPDRRIDLYGETGVGTNVGLLLARESWVRTFIGSAMFYTEFGPAVASTLFNPGFRAGVSSIPGGYAPQDAGFISGFFGGADPAVQAEALAACLGPPPQIVPTGALIELFAVPYTTAAGPLGPVFVLDHPIVEAAPARADALFIQAAPDFIGSENGTATMAAEYGSTGGGDATVVTLAGASHLMRFDVATSNGPSSAFWSPILTFLAAH